VRPGMAEAVAGLDVKAIGRGKAMFGRWASNIATTIIRSGDTPCGDGDGPGKERDSYKDAIARGAEWVEGLQSREAAGAFDATKLLFI